MICWEWSTAICAAWVWCLIILVAGMGLFSVVPLAANMAPGCSGTGPGVMVVPASCTLLYTGAERLQLDLYILAKEVDPFRDCSGLVFRDSHDESAGERILG